MTLPAVAMIITLISLLGNVQEVMSAFNSEIEGDLEQRIRASIEDYIKSKTDKFGNKFLIGGFVALVFHDCVGGCDGCINDMHPLNFPVIRYIHEAEHIYKNYSQFLSRADFWAMAGIVSTNLALGANINRTDKLVFRTGRVDCSTSPFTNKFNKFPTNGPLGDFDNVFDFLQMHFGYNDRQAVAIMGAHTLGRMRREESGSGFIGPFTNNPDTLNNEYFKILVQNEWIQINTAIKSKEQRESYKKHQWTDLEHVNGTFENVPMALNVDIAIYRNISITRTGKVVTPINHIPFSRTKDIVEEFAENNDVWLEEYIPAFQAMIEAGCEEDESGNIVPAKKQYPIEKPWSKT